MKREGHVLALVVVSLEPLFRSGPPGLQQPEQRLLQLLILRQVNHGRDPEAIDEKNATDVNFADKVI